MLKKINKLFTLEQIKQAHKKVKSGADFPVFIKDIKHLGVTHFDTFVSDGHTDYFGTNNYKISSPPEYETLVIADISNEEQFKHDLKAHQNGKTDYPTFCLDAAKSGVYKWAVHLDEMTCTYCDKGGKKILIEEIPKI
ncbi:hypothetical protein ABK040_011970 [Willaertia magna]